MNIRLYARLAACAVTFALASANVAAQFVSGQTLTAAALNAALAAPTITGGSIIGVPGSFTALSSSGQVIAGYGNPIFNANDTSGSGIAKFALSSTGSLVWDILKGSGASGNFFIERYNAGVFVDNPIQIANSSGIVTMIDGAAFGGATSVSYANSVLTVNDSSGSSGASFQINSGGSPLWEMKKSSSNQFSVGRYVSGTFTDNPISIANATGIVGMADGLTVKGATVLGNLVGTSSSIGGSALAAAACATGTVSISGATTAMAVAVSPVANPGTGYVWEGYVSAAGTATVNVCAIAAGTPTATTYNVRVIQ